MLTVDWTALLSQLLLIQLLAAGCRAGTEILMPRGVSFSKKVFYDPSKDFTCLDGSLSIPFLMVNDDYCDCADGSDEPGTSACRDGQFHCSNIGFVEKLIPSSRVNDGICDCCDASDEYNSSAECGNNCMELGQQMREEKEREKKLMEEGSKIRNEYIEQAKKKIEESRVQLEELRKSKEQLEAEKNAKEAIKKEAEEREKAALDKYKAEEERIKKQEEEEELKRIQEEEHRAAEASFKEMDLNGDGRLSYTEVQQFNKFDKDGDGAVSDEEAKFFLHAASEMELEEFKTTAWIIMKPYYLKDIQLKTAPDSTTSKVEKVDEQIEPDVDNPDLEPDSGIETEDTNTNDEEQPSEDEEDEEDKQPPYFPPKDADLLETTTSSYQPPEYDEETKNLIEIAKKAREEYNDIEGRFLDSQNKFRELEVLLETDFGQQGEFMPLQGQCFELTDREYTYKLCPFESASQKSKDGGTETSLGRWGKWLGSESNKYEKMKFEGGAQCWNGPARSVVVNLFCGTTNQLTSASEPSRCEYEYNFSTPAICDQTGSNPEHDEL